jgi:hypothetical protein
MIHSNQSFVFALTVLTLAGINAHAAGGTKYICKEIDAEDAKRTVILTQNGDREFSEGEREPFTLEVYKTGQKTPVLTAEGRVSTEDVMFTFRSFDRRTSFHIYLDELDQSALTVNRRSSNTRFDCE